MANCGEKNYYIIMLNWHLIAILISIERALNMVLLSSATNLDYFFEAFLVFGRVNEISEIYNIVEYIALASLGS